MNRQNGHIVHCPGVCPRRGAGTVGHSGHRVWTGRFVCPPRGWALLVM